MADERHDKNQKQDPKENLENPKNVEVEELEDKGLEDVSGGQGTNGNCSC